MHIDLDKVELYKHGYCYWCPLFNRGPGRWICRAGYYPETKKDQFDVTGYKRDKKCVERFGR